jgi:hypothetical protein
MTFLAGQFPWMQMVIEWPLVEEKMMVTVFKLVTQECMPTAVTAGPNWAVILMVNPAKTNLAGQYPWTQMVIEWPLALVMLTLRMMVMLAM